MFGIPSTEDCLKMMDEYGMPDNIKAHSFKVRDISILLARELNDKGEIMDLNLVGASALLHDIAKIQCISSDKRHDLVGADILRRRGYDSIAEVVEQHIDLVGKEDRITEEDIIFYADKRVMHDKIVSLSERFEDVNERYASDNADLLKKIDFTRKKSYELERRIFKNLDFSPEDLVSLIK